MNQKQLEDWSKEFGKDASLSTDPGFQMVLNMLGRIIMETPSLIIFTTYIQAFIVWAFMAGLKRGRKESVMKAFVESEKK